MLISSLALCFPLACFADEYSNLNRMLNKVDQNSNWTRGRSNYYTAPPVTPTPQAFSNSYTQYGMPYANASIAALRNSTLWRNLTHAGNAGMATQSGGNPFNLSPFGMLHYMWDDTNYVSAANPMTLYQTQSELQNAQHYSQMAQAAAARAKYSRNAQEREEAAQKARYYAGLAQQAARQAQEVSQSGSLNPADVAQAALEQANSAQNYASQASNYARRGF